MLMTSIVLAVTLVLMFTGTARYGLTDTSSRIAQQLRERERFDI